MDVKFGKIRPNSSNFFEGSLSVNPVGNFFSSNSDKENKKREDEKPSKSSRINDYDSNLLENSAYQAIPDESFKTEYKIEVLEETLDKINNEIITLEGLGYDIQISDLKYRKQKLEQELAELNAQYSDLDLSAKLSSRISTVVNIASKGKKNLLSAMKDKFSQNILPKVSKKISYAQKMKEALNNLTKINENVDELVKMQAPFGENITRYEKLTGYLNRANIIHAQIAKNIHSEKKK